MLSTYEASTPKLYSSFACTRVRVGFVVTSLLFSSRSCLSSARTSLMVCCFLANNKSSTRAALASSCVCPQASVKHVLDEAALPVNLLQMVLPTSRCASQTKQTFLQFPDHSSFVGIQCSWLPLRRWPCVHHVTVLYMRVEKGEFHVGCEQCNLRF